jgi:hypothetical protein
VGKKTHFGEIRNPVYETARVPGMRNTVKRRSREGPWAFIGAWRTRLQGDPGVFEIGSARWKEFVSVTNRGRRGRCFGGSHPSARRGGDPAVGQRKKGEEGRACWGELGRSTGRAQGGEGCWAAEEGSRPGGLAGPTAAAALAFPFFLFFSKSFFQLSF